MCAITQSFVDEGKIIGVVEYLKNVRKSNYSQSDSEPIVTDHCLTNTPVKYALRALSNHHEIISPMDDKVTLL